MKATEMKIGRWYRYKHRDKDLIVQCKKQTDIHTECLYYKDHCGTNPPQFLIIRPYEEVEETKFNG